MLWKKSQNLCNLETTKKSIMDLDLHKLSSYGKKIYELTDIQQSKLALLLEF